MDKPTRCRTHTIHHQAGCGDCRRYAREYREYRLHHLDAGTWNVTRVPAQPVRDHLRTLLDAGMSLTVIAATSGVSGGTVNRILYMPHVHTCAKRNADALLAVAARDGNRRSVDGTGTRRRIRALMRAGWSQGDIAGRLGFDHSVVSEWATLADGGRVHPDSADVVRILYGRMYAEDGPSQRVRRWAERRGWHPPEAWSDATIDDPEAEPYDWCRDDVDEVAIDLVEAGERRWSTLNDAEQRELVRRHVGTFRPATLASRWGTTRVKVERLAAELAAEAGQVAA